MFFANYTTYFLNYGSYLPKYKTYLLLNTGLDEQAGERCRMLIQQTATAEGVSEDLKRRSHWEWVRVMNSIVNRAEEIVQQEIQYRFSTKSSP